MADVPADEGVDELLLRAVAGDVAALNMLANRYREAVRNTVRFRFDSRLCSRCDPSDVVQDTFLVAFQRLKEYLTRRPMPFDLWLKKTAIEQVQRLRERHLIAEKRSLRREVPLIDESSEILFQRLFHVRTQPDARMIQRESAIHVHEALQELADRDREILILRYVEGLSNQQIAEMLETEPNTISQRHGRALRRMQELLDRRAHADSDGNRSLNRGSS